MSILVNLDITDIGSEAARSDRPKRSKRNSQSEKKEKGPWDVYNLFQETIIFNENKVTHSWIKDVAGWFIEVFKDDAHIYCSIHIVIRSPEFDKFVSEFETHLESEATIVADKPGED